MILQIKNRYNETVTFQHDEKNNTMLKTLRKAVKSSADLSGVNLRNSNLSGVDLSYLDLSGAEH